MVMQPSVLLEATHRLQKKKNNLLVMLLELYAKGNYCKGPTISLLGEGVGDSFWQGFFSLNLELLVGHLFGLWCMGGHHRQKYKPCRQLRINQNGLIVLCRMV